MKKQMTIKHGGARPGAGRKKAKPTTTLSFRVPEELAPKLRVKITALIAAEIFKQLTARVEMKKPG